jgi:hypothetical protein
MNPVSDLISVPLENNFTFSNGPEDAFAYILNVRPVIPTGISKNWNLINRIIPPVVYHLRRDGVIIVKDTTMRGHNVQMMVPGPTISTKLPSSAFQRLVSPINVRLSLTSSAQKGNVLLI